MQAMHEDNVPLVLLAAENVLKIATNYCPSLVLRLFSINWNEANLEKVRCFIVLITRVCNERLMKCFVIVLDKFALKTSVLTVCTLHSLECLKHFFKITVLLKSTELRAQDIL